MAHMHCFTEGVFVFINSKAIKPFQHLIRFSRWSAFICFTGLRRSTQQKQTQIRREQSPSMGQTAIGYFELKHILTILFWRQSGSVSREAKSCKNKTSMIRRSWLQLPSHMWGKKTNRRLNETQTVIDFRDGNWTSTNQCGLWTQDLHF